MDKLLNDIFYDNKTGFIDVSKLYKKVKEIDNSIKYKDVVNWYKNQSINQEHKYVNEKKINYKPIMGGFNSCQCNLTFLPKFKNTNKGYYVLLTIIEINTRMGYAY